MKIYTFLNSQKQTLFSVCLFALLCVSTSITAFSQSKQGAISGVIKDTAGSPLAQVTVSLKGKNKSTVTNAAGEFLLQHLNPGKYTLQAHLLGHVPLEFPVEVETDFNTKVPNLSLLADVHQLEDVIVNSGRNKYKINNPSASMRLVSPILEIPQNVQVITNDVLKDQQIISMSDGLVRNVSGLVRAEHWGDMYTNITARGSQVQAFRNGFNVVNSYWGPLTEDMSFVENIEFVKGPAGFMLSSGDPSGLYNVVTKKPTGQNRGQAAVTVGSYNLYRASLDLDGKITNDGRLLYRLNISAQNKNTHRANEYNNRYVFAPVISYQLDEKTKLTAEYNYQRADMSNVGSYYIFSPEGFGQYAKDFTTLPAGTPGTTMNDHSFYLNLQHNFNSSWKITAQAARFVFNQQGASMWPSAVNADGTMIRNIGIWDAASRMSMAQVFVNGDVYTGFIRHRILGGLDMANKNYIADWSQSHDLDTAGAAFNPGTSLLGLPENGYPKFDRSRSLSERAYGNGSFQNQTYYSFYLQDEIGFFSNRMRLTLAGRYTDLKQEYYGTEKASHFTPRVGLSGSVNATTAIYALYDQSFIPQAGILTNGGKVKPITGNNMELGVKTDWFGGKWNTTLAFYRILKNNELTPDPKSQSNPQTNIELGQKRTQGIEFDLRGNIAKGLNLIANYAYTDSRVSKVGPGVEDIKVGDVVPGYSKHTMNGWLSYKIQAGILKNTGVSVGFTVLLDRATYWEAAPDPSKEINNYYKMDGGIFWENDRIKITANGFNLLNAYLYSGSYYKNYFNTPVYSYQTEPGRNGRLSLNYSF